MFNSKITIPPRLGTVEYFRDCRKSDPFVPREIAYYIPPNPTQWLHGEPSDPTQFNLHARPLGPVIATTEDVIVDSRRNIFMDTYHDGLYILRCSV